MRRRRRGQQPRLCLPKAGTHPAAGLRLTSRRSAGLPALPRERCQRALPRSVPGSLRGRRAGVLTSPDVSERPSLRPTRRGRGSAWAGPRPESPLKTPPSVNRRQALRPEWRVGGGALTTLRRRGQLGHRTQPPPREVRGPGKALRETLRS